MSTKLCFFFHFLKSVLHTHGKATTLFGANDTQTCNFACKEKSISFCMQKPCIAKSHDTVRTNGTRSIHVRPYEFDLQGYHLQSKSLEPYTCFAHLHP